MRSFALLVFVTLGCSHVKTSSVSGHFDCTDPQRDEPDCAAAACQARTTAVRAVCHEECVREVENCIETRALELETCRAVNYVCHYACYRAGETSERGCGRIYL